MAIDKMEIETVKTRDLEIGDRISLSGVQKPAHVIIEIQENRRIVGLMKARLLTVQHDDGEPVDKLFALVKPMRREVRAV